MGTIERIRWLNSELDYVVYKHKIFKPVKLELNGEHFDILIAKEDWARFKEVNNE